jgi:hypothetical protein
MFTEQTWLVRVVPTELIFEIIDKLTPRETTEEAHIEDIGVEQTNEQKQEE